MIIFKDKLSGDVDYAILEKLTKMFVDSIINGIIILTYELILLLIAIILIRILFISSKIANELNLPIRRFLIFYGEKKEEIKDWVYNKVKKALRIKV